MRIEIDDLQKTYGRGICALDRVRLTLESPGMVGMALADGVLLIWAARRRYC